MWKQLKNEGRLRGCRREWHSGATCVESLWLKCNQSCRRRCRCQSCFVSSCHLPRHDLSRHHRRKSRYRPALSESRRSSPEQCLLETRTCYRQIPTQIQIRSSRPQNPLKCCRPDPSLRWQWRHHRSNHPRLRSCCLTLKRVFMSFDFIKNKHIVSSKVAE